MTLAVLLVGHGTRNETGQRQFMRLAEHVRAAVSVPLAVAYIEVQSPTIGDALVRLYEQGIRHVVLSPALLFAAGHAKKDIPTAVAAARELCPDLRVDSAEPLGCHHSILELAALRVRSALDKNSSLSSVPSVLRAKTCGEGRGEGPDLQIDPAIQEATLVLIGRGSSDPTAIEHCRDFASKLATRLQIKNVHTGFIAIARPSLSEVLEQAAAGNPQQVIVLPHLLFTGEMLETTTAAVLNAQRSHPHIHWRQAEILGSDLLEPESHAARLLIKGLVARSP